MQRTRDRRWARRHPEHDYSDRVGMPRPPDAMRGTAAKTVPAEAKAFGSNRLPGARDERPGNDHPNMLSGAGP